jgi:hypothetical protein
MLGVAYRVRASVIVVIRLYQVRGRAHSTVTVVIIHSKALNRLPRHAVASSANRMVLSPTILRAHLLYVITRTFNWPQEELSAELPS